MSIIAVVGILIACTSVQAAIPYPRCLFICTADYRPVCGNDLKTYPNECAMRTAACEQKQAIIAVYNQECKEKPNECSFLCTREYMPVCGSDGKKYANECTMKAKSCQTGKAITVVSKFAFEHTDCGSPTACNIPCTRDIRPICGSDGKTHSNECEMRVKSCKTRTAIVKVHDGFCR